MTTLKCLRTALQCSPFRRSRSTFSSISEIHTTDPFPKTGHVRVRLHSRSILRVGGPDAGKYLQGLVSNDVAVEGFEERHGGSVAYAGFFNHKGRFSADALIALRPPENDTDGDVFLLDVDKAVAEDLLKHLKRYRLRSKVEIDDVSDAFVVESWISGDRHLLSHVKFSVEALQLDEAVAFYDPRLAALGVRSFLPSGSQVDAEVQQRFEVGGEEDFAEVWRMLHGVPRFGLELVPDTSIPLEFNLDWLNGIAFNKGCYLGQELIARTHFRGVIRKRLVPVFLSEAVSHTPSNALLPPCGVQRDWPYQPLQNGSAIRMGDTKVGRMLSNRGNIGLALLRLEALYSPSNAFSCEGFGVHPSIPSWWLGDTPL